MVDHIFNIVFLPQLAVKQWASPLGLTVLAGLSQLYTTLVAESTILYAVCSEDHASDSTKDDGAKSGTDSKVCLKINCSIVNKILCMM